MRPGFQRESDMFSHTFRVAICLIGAACIVTTGCSMCCGPFDYDYPTFGGNRPRVDRSHGRVGSPFSDPAGNIAGPSADSNLTPVEPAPDLDLSEGDDFDNGLEEDLGDPEGLGEKEPQSGFDGKLETIEPESLRDDATSPPDNSEAGDRTGATSNLWRPSPLRRSYR